MSGEREREKLKRSGDRWDREQERKAEMDAIRGALSPTEEDLAVYNKIFKTLLKCKCFSLVNARVFLTLEIESSFLPFTDFLYYRNDNYVSVAIGFPRFKFHRDHVTELFDRIHNRRHRWNFDRLSGSCRLNYRESLFHSSISLILMTIFTTKIHLSRTFSSRASASWVIYAAAFIYCTTGSTG